MAREKTERPSEATPGAPHVSLSVAELRQLITLMNGSEIEEIGIEEASSGLRLSLRKPAPLAAAAPPGVEDDTLEYLIADGVAENPPSTTVEVTSPLVGLFRAGMKPGARPLCGVGDIVREGQVVCAVEALNVFNEVEAPAAGRLLTIYAADGQPVEYGQPLLAIEPQG
ncbi:MAG TPA: biotin/lipoyl-containing protein [Ktedonobacterales bacterium]|nr:biotin/lipoyl-containing protein [Ktedonobacterales bacterium]